MAKAKKNPKARKNSYRMRFTLPDGSRVEYTAHTLAEHDQVDRHVPKLISAKRVGASCLESEEWAAKLPKGILRDSLIRWKLIEDTSNQERTLKDLYEVFLPQERTEKERTYRNRQNCFNNLFSYFGEDCLLRDIGKDKAEEFISYLRREGNQFTGGGLAINTLGGRIKRFRQFFKYALEENWIEYNPFIRFKATSEVNIDRLKYISKEETMRVIAFTPNLEHKVIIALLRFCGLRGASELARLTFDESCLHLSRDGEAAEVFVPCTKVEHHAGHERRPIPLTPYVERLILDLWGAAPEGQNKLFPRMKMDTNIGVVIKKIFVRYNKELEKRYSKEEYELHKIDISRVYNLRDSYVTDLMAEGMHEKDPAMFELLAGHDVKVSLKHYQILTNERKKKATAKFLEIMDVKPEEKAPPILPPPAPFFAPGSNSQYPAECNKKNGLSLENREYCEITKKPCEIPQGVKLPQVGFEPITLGSEDRCAIQLRH